MKLPLYAKLLLSLAVNLALIAGLLLAGGSGAGWNWLLSAQVRDRLAGIAQDFTEDFSQAAPDARAALAQKYHERYGVDFILRLPEEGMMMHGPHGPGGMTGDRPFLSGVLPPPLQGGGPETRMPPPGFGGGALPPPDEFGPPPMHEREQRAHNIRLHALRDEGYELRIPATLNENTPRARGREVLASNGLLHGAMQELLATAPIESA